MHLRAELVVLLTTAITSAAAQRCGTAFGNSCEAGFCCSSGGWCGVGFEYCSAPSCQIEFGPACDANVRPNGPDTANTPRPKVGRIPYGQAIYRCNRNGDIALTYDDGPYTYTEDLLDLLDEYDAKATFFVTGRNLGKGAINDESTPWPALIRRMAASGHQIASHTWSHQRLPLITESKFRNQMLYLETALSDILGYFPTYMRPPYSASNAAIDGWLGDLGYHVTYFNLDTEGYLHDSADTIQESKDIWDLNVEGRNPAGNKFLHIEHDPVFQAVYNLTEYMLISMRRNGFDPVTVGDCLEDPRENWYRTPSEGGNGGGSSSSTTSRSTQTPTRSGEPPLQTSSRPDTTDGRCGPNGRGQTCVNEPGATCCSQYGWCGATAGHCGAGCLSAFGTCGTSGR